jgi:hypothetical protein
MAYSRLNHFRSEWISSSVGEIIYWGLIRFAAVLVAAWVLYSVVPNYSDWWMMFFIAVSVIVVYPAQLAWRKHVTSIRHANQNALCATCRHLVPSEALCGKLDEHVTKDYTPCGGEGWEPLSN